MSVTWPAEGERWLVRHARADIDCEYVEVLRTPDYGPNARVLVKGEFYIPVDRLALLMES